MGGGKTSERQPLSKSTNVGANYLRTLTISGSGDMIVLIYGKNPLARRLAYYITEYSATLGQNIAAVHFNGPANNIDLVQREIWAEYVSASQSVMPGAVINAIGAIPGPSWAFQSAFEYVTAFQSAFEYVTLPAANLALASRSADIPFWQFSSEQVFSGTSGPYSVEDTPAPRSPYGIAMWYAEQAVAELYPDTSVLRLPVLYGSGIDVMSNNVFSTPAFVAEAAFLIARNFVHNVGIRDEISDEIIHVAPNAPNIPWRHLEDNDSTIYVGRPEEQYGLVPTRSWALPSDYSRSFADHTLEVDSGECLIYW